MKSGEINHHPDGLPQPERGWAILTIAIGLIMSVMDGAIANVALPTIARDLHASPAFSIWIVNGYQLAITISLLPLASLGEIVGYRRVYIGGPVAVHHRVAVLRARAHADAVDDRPHPSGVRRCRDHERQHGAGPAYLSARAAGTRDRHQRHGGRGLRRGRADDCGRYSRGRPMALSVCDQYSAWHWRAGTRHQIPAVHQTRRPRFRLEERGTQRGRLWPRSRRHRQHRPR